MKTILGQRLRHRITFQRQERVLAGGEYSTQWVSLPDLENVPAEILPLSGREFLQSQIKQSEVTDRITIRFQTGITTSMRILHGAAVYNIQAVLPDPTGVRWLTIMASHGVNDGN